MISSRIILVTRFCKGLGKDLIVSSTDSLITVTTICCNVFGLHALLMVNSLPVSTLKWTPGCSFKLEINVRRFLEPFCLEVSQYFFISATHKEQLSNGRSGKTRVEETNNKIYSINFYHLVSIPWFSEVHIRTVLFHICNIVGKTAWIGQRVNMSPTHLVVGRRERGRERI